MNIILLKFNVIQRWLLEIIPERLLIPTWALPLYVYGNRIQLSSIYCSFRNSFFLLYQMFYWWIILFFIFYVNCIIPELPIFVTLLKFLIISTVTLDVSQIFNFLLDIFFKSLLFMNIHLYFVIIDLHWLNAFISVWLRYRFSVHWTLKSYSFIIHSRRW